MAQRFCLLLTSTLLLASSCQRTAPQMTAGATSDCIDPTKIDSAGICTMEYAPVCGCNGQTYPNPCAARKAGLRTFTVGPCPTRP